MNETYENRNNANNGNGTKRRIVAALVLLLVFGGGVFFDRFMLRGGGPQGSGPTELNRENAPAGADWQILWDAIEHINTKYVDRPADLTRILYGAVSGAVASLGDDYSAFLPPREADDFQNELSGRFEGIGAEIALKNERLVVVAPLDDSPAERAGIKAGDSIVKVNGEETADFTLEQAVGKIRGPAGSKVTLTVFRGEAADPFDVEITRAAIVVKSVEWEIRSVEGKKIGHLKLRRFGDDTSGAVSDAVSDFLRENVAGVVVDVRNNPGGFLETAVEVLGNWVPAGETVLIQKFGNGDEEVFASSGPARLANMRTVVLMNGGSASASEILAGALKDHDLATLVGEKSFGKGSVQELIDLRGGSDLKLTVAKWLTPSGHDLNKEGLPPDVLVEMTDDDFNQDRDPQLDRALELLAG